MASVTGTFTATTDSKGVQAAITIDGKTRNIAIYGQYAADAKLADPVAAAVYQAAVAGTSSGTITVTAA